MPPRARTDRPKVTAFRIFSFWRKNPNANLRAMCPRRQRCSVTMRRLLHDTYTCIEISGQAVSMQTYSNLSPSFSSTRGNQPRPVPAAPSVAPARPSTAGSRGARLETRSGAESRRCRESKVNEMHAKHAFGWTILVHDNFIKNQQRRYKLKHLLPAQRRSMLEASLLQRRAF